MSYGLSRYARGRLTFSRDVMIGVHCKAQVIDCMGTHYATCIQGGTDSENETNTAATGITTNMIVVPFAIFLTAFYLFQCIN